jgi:hypothetical protein
MQKHVSFDSEMYLMIFGWKWIFSIRDEKVCLTEIDERKSLKFDENNALCLGNKWEV